MSNIAPSAETKTQARMGHTIGLHCWRGFPKETDMEIWAYIQDFTIYEVSTYGRIRATRHGKTTVLRCCNNPDGYLRADLRYQGRRRYATVHRLVLETFRGQPQPGEEARHLDGTKHNNYLSNLIWDTRRNNMQDKVRHGTHSRGSRSPNAKLTEQQVLEIRRRFAAGEHYKALADEYDVSHRRIHYIARREVWSWLEDPE